MVIGDNIRVAAGHGRKVVNGSAITAASKEIAIARRAIS